MGKSVREGLEPDDLFSNFVDDIKVSPTTSLEKSNAPSTTEQYQFDPSNKYYEYIDQPTPFTTDVDKISAQKQSAWSKWGRGLEVGGANLLSSFGQSLISTFDLVEGAHTAKALATGSDTDFNPSLMGVLSIKDLSDWSKGIAERNQIFEKNPGSFSPGDVGWWTNQMLPQMGTLVGTAGAALLTTAAIEGTTEGIGTATAAANLLNSIKNAWGVAKAGEIVKGGLDLVRGMRGAAAMYATISRYSESMFEAQNNYGNTMEKLSHMAKPDGSDFTEEEKKHLASAGAKVDFSLTMAQLPLDILAMRAMIFNPLTGTAEGTTERVLEKIAGAYGESKLGKLAGTVTTHGIGAVVEGFEAGGIPIFQAEGEHHAMVLGGLDNNKSTWQQRVGEDIKSPEFANMVSSGILGSLLIGPSMNAAKNVINSTRIKAFNEKYKDYIENVVPSLNNLANSITEADTNGNTKLAAIMRKRFNADRILDALTLDNQAGKSKMFDAHINFLQSTLDQANNSKATQDNVNDLFGKATPEQITQIKNEFQTYIDDAKNLKDIFNEVGQRYNRNLVPIIANQHFTLKTLLKEQAIATVDVATQQANLSQYNLLSPQGKQIYDINHQLLAANAEKDRLTTQLTTTENEHEKEGIRNLLDRNKTKLTELANRVKEANSNEAYIPELKDTDHDIMGSMWGGKEYGSAIYTKENLDNQVALLQKKINLWNKPEYLKSITQKSIKNAKTTEQLKNNIPLDKKVEPEVAQNIREKEAEIEAENASTTIVQPGDKFDNDNLSADDEKHMDNIGDAMNSTPKSNLAVDQSGNINETSESITNKEVGDNKNEDSSEPQVYDFENSPPEAKQKVIDGTKGLLDKLGEGASFEDLVRHVVKVKGKDFADKTFNGWKYGWEKNGKDPVDYNTVYRSIFGDPMDQATDGLSQLMVSTPAQVEQVITQTTDDIVASGEQPQGFDENNQPNYNYKKKDGSKAFVTNESSPKFAFITFVSKLIRKLVGDNTVEITHEQLSEDINENEYLDSTPLIDPKKFRPGTAIEIRRPTNFMDIVIPVYNPNGTKVEGSHMTFGQWVAAHPEFPPESQEYKDKLPLIIFRKGAPKEEKGVAFVHDIGWYTPNNFNILHPNDMKDAIAATRAIREEVINSGNFTTTGKVTSKRETTFGSLKVKKAITLKEANPQIRFMVVGNDLTSLKDNKSNVAFSIGVPNTDSKLINTKPFQHKGQIVEVRRYGTDTDGKETYIANPLFRGKLETEAIDSIIQAITIYASKNFLTEKQKAVVKHIKDTMGSDVDIIESPKGKGGVANGLKAYLSHFIRIYDPSNSSTAKQIEDQAKAGVGGIKTGTPYIAFINGGNIIFGVAGQAAFVDTKGNPVYSYFINNDSSKLSPYISKLNEPVNLVDSDGTTKKMPRLSWYEHNLSLDGLAANEGKGKPIVYIDKNNTTTIAANTYNDYLLDHYTTNLKSINIGTEKEPNYVTNVQPIITYDTDKNLANSIKQPTNEEVKKEVIPEVTTPETKTETTSIPTKSIEEIKRELKEYNDKKLGNDKGISKGDNDSESFEPQLLDTEGKEGQVKEIAKSIDRIAGLRPDQQTAVTKFIFNQIIGLVNFNTKSVTKIEIDEKVEKIFDDIMIPIRQDAVDTIAFNNRMIEDFPSLKEDVDIQGQIRDLETKIAMIDTIKNQFNTLKDIAYNEVKKNTGIKLNRLDKVEYEEGGNEYPDELTDRKTDFWIDVLTESPENKLSYSMRRFFGQTRQYDKNGVPKTGFLNLPLYEDSSSIIRKLMTTIVDAPPSFQTMIDKLKTKKESLSYLNDYTDKDGNTLHGLISKLENTTQQRKNQFVTVMHNTSLRMEKSLISYDRNKKAWTVRLIDETVNGIAGAVKELWRSNLLNDSHFDLLVVNEDSELEVNKQKAETLLHKFEEWTGKGIKSIENDITPIKNAANSLKIGEKVTVQLDGVSSSKLLGELRDNLVRTGDRMKFSISGKAYQIKDIGKGKYQIEFLKRVETGTDSELMSWLKEFGITISPDTMKALREGQLYHNYGKRSFNDLFETGSSNGLFGILYESLKSISSGEALDFTEEGSNPLDQSVVTSLANLEAEHSDIDAIFGFRVNGKGYFALTSPSFVSDRTTDLKDQNGAIRSQLRQVSFSQNSFWLNLLEDEDFRKRFDVKDDSAESTKQTGKKTYTTKTGLAQLSDMDHEQSKISKFSVTKGEIRYGKSKLNKYPDTGIAMRLATMFGLTMSDKDRMKLFTTAVLDLGDAHLKDGIHPEVLKAIYNETVKPELLRMIKHAQLTQNGKHPTNLVNDSKTGGYDKGASIFLMMPEMNNVKFNDNLKLVDAIKNKPFDFNQQFVEGNKDLMDSINNVIKNYVNELVQDKLEVWDKNKYTVKDKETGKITDIKFFDKKYLSKFSGTNEEKLRKAAMDYEINTLISNANQFMLFAGDPAMYFKSEDKTNDYVQQAKDTFTNINKRLANQVAPGTSIPDSQNEKYLQIFINDRKSEAENYKELVDLLGEKQAAAYKSIKGADAQEYTTWKEHLDLLNRLGKSSDFMFDITPEDIDEVRSLMQAGTKKKELTDRQLQTIQKVMQPIKPVYTGQLYDKDQDLMRTVYIKSSSFPLYEALTAGKEIDKLRKRMEQIEKNNKLNVRASYQSANKVGALDVKDNLWNEDGTINNDALKNLSNNMMQLDRKNFRIQQEVPFKSDKNKEDYITLGTQLMKLLFGDDVMNQSGFDYTYKGEKYDTGKALYQIYTNHFIALVKEKQLQLFNELGLDSKGEPIDRIASMNKLQTLLKNEAEKRNYPLQDIKGLEIDKETGNFKLPLWNSTNSNRYESMLNAIVSKRMIAMKFPGSSFVTGSEEGFRSRIKEEEGELTPQEKSGIIYTSHWNGNHLQANQVFVPSKFRGHDGLIDLLQKENNKYKYVTETPTGFALKEDMFDKELLQNIAFRIPTSGHQSGSLIEIAGFLPHTSGDLIITSKNSVVQKGLDFDVDKENAYQLWTHITKEGKLEVLSEKHRTELLDNADKWVDENEEDEVPQDVMVNAANKLAPEYNAEEIESTPKLKKANSKINEKLLHNEIIRINHSIYDNKSKDVQSKIARPLSTDFAEKQATLIEGLINQSKTTKMWTGLSSEHQKLSMIAGASSITGRGAYSLDVTFHSLVQQAKNSDMPLEFNSVTPGEEGDIIDIRKWKFGNTESTGVLGESNTMDGSRSISEVLAERQSMAVDNASLGNILGKLNLNDTTFDVDKVFNLLGIDKGSDGNSISLLFLSQPIIREYVSQMSNTNSIFSEFEQNKEQRIVNELLTKYDTTRDEDITPEYWNIMSGQMSNDNLITALSSQTPDGKLQGAVLRRFIEMKQYGLAIRAIQAAINFKNNSFGKSFFDVIDKKNALNRLGKDNIIKQNGVTIGTLSGASGLIGDYILADNADSIDESEVDNYIDIGKYLVKPNTVTGAFSINSTMTAYNLWNQHFPYDTEVIEAVFDEIMPIISNPEIEGGAKDVKTKQDIFQEIKKYLAANKMNGITRSTDDINTERYRLYIDSPTNVSLAMYLKTITQLYNNDTVNRYIKSNKLLNRFTYLTQKDGTPSKIKYSNTEGEEFDEQYLYEALSTLLTERDKNGARIKLPTVNNKSYTLDSLAQDLIAYCYLGNAIQEAIQFTKYIPVSYLNTVGYSDWLTSNTNTLGIKTATNKLPGTEHLVSEYTMQYMQHNPGLVKYREIKVDFQTGENNIAEKTVEANSTDINKLQSFKLKNEDRPAFISIYNPFLKKGEIKYQLYWFDGEKYTRIPVLGAFGMDEYQPGTDIGQSIVNGRVKLKIKPQVAINVVQQDTSDIFGVNTGDLKTILGKIADSKIEGMSQLATALAPFVGTTAIKYDNLDGTRGIYKSITDEIGIDKDYAASSPSNILARTILHETVHSLTFRQINPFINQNADGSVDVKANAPAYVTNIVRLYNDIRSKVDTEDLQDILARVQGLKGEDRRLTKEEYNTKYGLTNIQDFMAMALTPGEFQKYLDRNEFKQSGQTFLQRFKDIIRDIFKSIGITFDSDSAATHAINSIFEFITETNEDKNMTEVNRQLQEDAYSDNFDDIEKQDRDIDAFLDRLDGDKENPNPIDDSFEPFPTKSLDIKEEKCI